MISYVRIQSVLNTKFKAEAWFQEILSYMIIRYYSVEKRMLETFRFVDCHPSNYGTFSYEYSSILRDSGSIFGSVMDRFVRGTSKKSTKEYNISDYRKWLTVEVAKVNLVKLRVNAPPWQRLTPLKGITTGKPRWWDAYNNVKHSDIDMIGQGNLGNALNSLGALAVLYALMDESPAIQVFDEIGFELKSKSLEEVLK